MEDETKRFLKKLIATYGYNNLLSELKKVEKEMAEEFKTMFQFNLFEVDGKDYLLLDNLISFLTKLEPYVMDLDLNEIKIETTKIRNETFLSLDQLLQLLNSLDPNVPSLKLAEIAAYVKEQSDAQKK